MKTLNTLAPSIALVAGSLWPLAAHAVVVRYTYNTQHNFSLAPVGTNSVWADVQSRRFVHAWAKQVGSPTGTANWRPGRVPTDPPMQPAGFYAYGFDSIASWPIASVLNTCPIPQCFPARTTTVTKLVTNIGLAGLPLNQIGVDIPALAHPSAYSEVLVNPYTNASPITGRIRSFGQWEQVGGPGFVYDSRSFAHTEFIASRRNIVTASPVTIMPISWAPVMRVLVPPQPWLPSPPPAPTYRVHDPVSFTISNALSGDAERGVIFAMDIDVADGTVDWEGENLTIDALHADITVTIEHPRVQPGGHLRLSVRNRVVVESFGDGIFDAALLPPVGLLGPVTAIVPPTFNLNLDLSGQTRNTIDVEIGMDGAGAVDLSPQGTCIADVDDGSGTGTPDGGVGIEDLLYYLFLFDAGNDRADVDDGSGTGTPDGGVGIEDLLYYLFRFDSGC